MVSPGIRPSVEEVIAHPAFPTAIWQFKTAQEGMLPVASSRGGPFNVWHEIHGHGDINLVFITGLGALRTTWQRQTLHFGHDNEDKYSCLLSDIRGMGRSDKPIMRYSTSEMARDIIEVLEHVGWTGERQLHILGISMGGMIAQELAMLIPNRISSLILISTAARIENTTTFLENLRTRINMFIPKPLDRTVFDGSRSLFSDPWLDSPDNCITPTTSTPSIIMPSSSLFHTSPLPAPFTTSDIAATYLPFPTNYHRFVAQEVTKRLDKLQFTRKGFILQAIAAGYHYKSAAQLRELGDKVGRARIVVMHGKIDNMITFRHCEVLMRELGRAGPGDKEDEGEDITKYIKEGSGHVLPIEMTSWFNGVVEAMVEKCERMEKS